MEISMVLDWNKYDIEKQVVRGTKYINDLDHWIIIITVGNHFISIINKDNKNNIC